MYSTRVLTGTASPRHVVNRGASDGTDVYSFACSRGMYSRNSFADSREHKDIATSAFSIELLTTYRRILEFLVGMHVFKSRAVNLTRSKEFRA